MEKTRKQRKRRNSLCASVFILEIMGYKKWEEEKRAVETVLIKMHG
jgi:hypothetical protein